MQRIQFNVEHTHSQLISLVVESLHVTLQSIN